MTNRSTRRRKRREEEERQEEHQNEFLDSQHIDRQEKKPAAHRYTGQCIYNDVPYTYYLL